jgi:hypothetical protein
MLGAMTGGAARDAGGGQRHPAMLPPVGGVAAGGIRRCYPTPTVMLPAPRMMLPAVGGLAAIDSQKSYRRRRCYKRWLTLLPETEEEDVVSFVCFFMWRWTRVARSMRRITSPDPPGDAQHNRKTIISCKVSK